MRDIRWVRDNPDATTCLSRRAGLSRKLSASSALAAALDRIAPAAAFTKVHEPRHSTLSDRAKLVAIVTLSGQVERLLAYDRSGKLDQVRDEWPR